jgi:hypothetical protein
MMVGRAPPALSFALRCLEQVDDGARLVVAHDLMSVPSLGRLNLEAARTYLQELLADADISNSDIKGILNRTLPYWYLPQWGRDAKAARAYAEAALFAIREWLG